jgi:lipopolysaccharide export system protein LptA
MSTRLQTCRLIALVAIVAAASVAGSCGAMAQGSSRGPTPFLQNRDQPMHIEAAKLEVREKEKVATFTGNVQVVQGDTTMRCASMVVYYDEGKSPVAKKPAAQGSGGGQQINRLEAKGGVIVIQKDQTATGETATFDVRTNTITMTGNVVINKGLDVTRGDRVVVDMTTGKTTVEGKGPVQVLINRGQSSSPRPGPARP